MTGFGKKKSLTQLPQKSVDVVSQITGGKLDYIIANAAYISDWQAFEPIGKL